MPASPWEFDEPLFFQALHRYDPLAHHPPPPGYPLFVGAGKLARMVAPSDFEALRAIGLAGSAIAFWMLALAFRNLSGDAATGTTGAALFFFSPAMLVHAALPISEPGALALIATSLYFASRSAPASFAVFAALAVGWRIQFAIFVVPLFFVAVPLMERRRDRMVALVSFALVCLAWLMPLIVAVGGVEELVRFEAAQGRYFAAQDATEARSGWTPAMVATRFIAHPWGLKAASLPLLGLAAAGVLVALARRRLPIALAAGGSAYFAFAVWAMDPADGVRYAIPAVLVVSFFAATGAVAAARRVGLPVALLPALFAAGSLVYAGPLLHQRRTTASPPLRAIEHAHRSHAKGAVAIYDLPLWPHAVYFLSDFAPRRLDEAMAAYYDRPDVPLFILADGASNDEGAATFSWAPSDAYAKLTRNHYRVASVIPVPPERRFLPLYGVHDPERRVDGLAWRWLAQEAALRLPRGGDRRVRLRLGLPPDAPLEANDVTIAVDGSPTGTHPARRGEVTAIEVAVPPGAPVVSFTSRHAAVPAAVPGSLSRDRRRLSVQMYDLSIEAAAGGLERPAGRAPRAPREAGRPGPRGAGRAAAPRLP
jgi:hypothetical protein